MFLVAGRRREGSRTASTHSSSPVVPSVAAACSPRTGLGGQREQPGLDFGPCSAAADYPPSLPSAATSSAASGRDQELLLMVVEVRGNLSPVRPGLDRCRPPTYPAWITAGSTWWMPGRNRVSAPSSEVVIKVTVILLLLAQTARAETVEDLIAVQAAWTRPPVRPSEPVRMFWT
ncbi:hypothetical protein [Streptomyces sp. NPDC048001]|uniref:hypothetical protein n=1 Tax=Streptomyces sp. NPDC048001 TaxID=3365498 RepID=UPI00371C8457